MEKKMINGVLMDLDETIKANDRLIWSIAKRFIPRGMQVGYDSYDLHSIATIGMIKAFKNFDPEKYNVKFSTYSVPMMIGEIQRSLRDYGGDLKFSRSIVDLANKIIKADMQEEKIEILMNHFDEDEVMINNALYYIFNQKAKSLNDVVYQSDKEDITLEDQIGDNKLADYSIVNVNEFLDSLPLRERTIIEMTMQGHKQADIGNVLGITQVQVSRILQKLYGKIEQFFGYPIGYFQNRKAVNQRKERVKVKRSRSKKGDLERAKELLRTTDMPQSEIVKLTGVNAGSVYYWAKKLREPQENPVTVSYIEPTKNDNQDQKLDETLIVNTAENCIMPEKLVVPKSVEIGYSIDNSLEKEREENELFNRVNKSFAFGINAEDVTPSEIHTIFTRVGHVAASSGIDKLNVSVSVSTK